jgi:predicted amino acid racemase
MPIVDGVMPAKVNQLRIGELSFCGPRDNYGVCYGRKEADVLSGETFILEAEVIETGVKPTYPVGEIGVDAFGQKEVYTDRGDRKRALLAVGRVDYGEIGNIEPMLEGAEVTMASGDHTILDIEDCKEQLRVGDIVRFKIKYSALLRLSTSENVTIEEINRQ